MTSFCHFALIYTIMALMGHRMLYYTEATGATCNRNFLELELFEWSFVLDGGCFQLGNFEVTNEIHYSVL